MSLALAAKTSTGTSSVVLEAPRLAVALLAARSVAPDSSAEDGGRS